MKGEKFLWKQSGQEKVFGVTIGFSLIYFVITMLAMMSGSFTPITWMFMTALIGLLAGVPYLYITARQQVFGVAIIMNLVVGLIYFVAGELSNLVIVTLAASAVLAETIRKASGYNSPKGNLFSYILFVFGMSDRLFIFGHSATIRSVKQQRKCRLNMRLLWIQWQRRLCWS